MIGTEGRLRPKTLDEAKNAEIKSTTSPPAVPVETTQELKFDLAMANRYLNLLTGNQDELVTFQLFDDTKKNPGLARIIHGRLREILPQLVSAQKKGASIFVMVNAGDGQGRTAKNVIKVRAIFLDLDGADPQPAITALKPHVVVESSPGKFHLYWFVCDCPLDRFTPIQEALIKKFGGDKAVKDLPRVMRIPGFFHLKKEPVMTKLVEVNNLPEYTVKQIIDGLGLDLSKPQAEKSGNNGDGKKAYRETWEGTTEGNRHADLVKLMGSWINHGLSQEHCLQNAHTWNARNKPPEADKEIETQVRDLWDRYHSEATEWPDPIPLNRYADLPAFPIDSLPALGREFVEAGAKINQVDAGLTGSLYLGALSTCLGGKVKVDLLTHTEPCNLYLAPILDSGERKSSTVSVMIEPIFRQQTMKAEEMAAEIRGKLNQHRIREARLAKLQKKAADADDAGTRAGLIREARDIADEIASNPVPKAPIYIFDDITPEKLGDVMVGNAECGSIISAEGGIFDIMAGRYSDGKANLDLLLKAHAGDQWSCHRIGREAVSMNSPSLTLALAVQTSVIREIGADKRFQGRGLLARFLYSFCQPRAGHRERQTDSIPETLKNRYDAHLTALLNLPKLYKPLTLAPDAQALWDAFYNDVEHEMRPGGSLEYAKAWGSKLAGAVARVAGLLHVAEHGIRAFEQPISVSIVTASAVIGGYFQEHALGTFGLMGEDPKIEAAKLILEYIIQYKPETFKGRDVLRHKNAFKTMEEVQPGLNILTERGYIREGNRKQSGDKGGRPGALEYEVNPRVLKNH